MLNDQLSLETSLYRIMLTIRRFEETLLDLFASGVISGTTHTYLGQEANAAGILANLQAGDIVFSNHRCHGHFLAYGGSPHSLFAELMGKSSGVCGGRGGSQHLQWRNFYSNGVQGGIVPVATGIALAERALGRSSVTLAFLGDGTLGEGVIYEAFNMASLWQAPVLFVVENNRIAQTTSIQAALAGKIGARFTAFEIAFQELESCDARQIYQVANRLLEEIRAGAGPRALILHTNRFGPHSKGDDTRPIEDVAALRTRFDPLQCAQAWLPPGAGQEIEAQVNALIARAAQQALADPLADPLSDSSFGAALRPGGMEFLAW